MAIIGAEVGRADEDGIHALDRQNVVQRGNTCRGLDLHDEAHLAVGRGQVIGMAGKTGRPRAGAADPANAGRRIAHRAHQHLGLLAAFDHRHDQCLAAHIEDLLDHMCLANMRANRRRGVVTGNGLKLCQYRWQIVR